MADRVITFTQEGDFQAYYAACTWCKENGYSYGSMQAGAPTGILKGSFSIAKWRNLNSSERKALSGTIRGVTSFREAPIHIVLKGEG